MPHGVTLHVRMIWSVTTVHRRPRGVLSGRLNAFRVDHPVPEHVLRLIRRSRHVHVTNRFHGGQGWENSKGHGHGWNMLKMPGSSCLDIQSRCAIMSTIPALYRAEPPSNMLTCSDLQTKLAQHHLPLFCPCHPRASTLPKTKDSNTLKRRNLQWPKPHT